MSKNIHVKWKSTTCSWESIYMRTRKDWGNICPVTRVIPDKRHKPPKHKGRSWDE